MSNRARLAALEKRAVTADTRVAIATKLDDGMFRLSDGRVVDQDALTAWASTFSTPVIVIDF